MRKIISLLLLLTLLMTQGVVLRKKVHRLEEERL